MVNPVQAAHPAATQVPPLAEAPEGQNCLSVPPSVAQVVSVAATHKPGLAGAAVKPVQSLLQSVEQRLVPEQKFLLPSAAQVVASAATHVPAVAGAAVAPVQSLQSVEQRLVPEQKFLLLSAWHAVSVGV